MSRIQHNQKSKRYANLHKVEIKISDILCKGENISIICRKNELTTKRGNICTMHSEKWTSFPFGDVQELD